MYTEPILDRFSSLSRRRIGIGIGRRNQLFLATSLTLVNGLTRVENSAPVASWVEDWVIRPGSPDFVAAESFSTCADTWIVW
jgi:hypothetical protein